MKLIFNIIFIILFLNCFMLASNVNIEFKVISKSTAESANIYIAGNHILLGNWTPDKIRLNYKSNYIWHRIISFPKNTTLKFKFTRGNWESEALNHNGTVLQNHELIVRNDTTLEFHIENWRDNHIKNIMRKITGKFEFHQKMNFPGLKPRDVIVWLPPDYEDNFDKRYPVLYMHDGQNLFDPGTSYLGIDWQIDETTDSLIINKKIKPILIVGIYNTGNRADEYGDTPLGQTYMKFIVNKLKPFIDQKYRTLPNRENTATGGSSMGGLISFMIVWEYSQIFSKAICMSPALKVDSIDYVIKVKNYSGDKKDIKIYIDNGGLELEERLQPGIKEMLNTLEEKGYRINNDLLWFKDNEAQHNESAWAERFWRPLLFLYKH